MNSQSGSLWRYRVRRYSTVSFQIRSGCRKSTDLHIYLFLGHELGDDRQAGLLSGVVEQFLFFKTHVPKIVRRGMGFEGSSPLNFSTRRLDSFISGNHLRLVFYCSRTRHDYWFRAAYDGFHHVYRAIFRMEIPTGQLV